MTTTTKKFQRKKENFICDYCGEKITGTGYTNHCSKCLYTKHVDIYPGDRLNKCKGIMKPIAVIYAQGGYTIQHQCLVCGYKARVKSKSEDNTKILIQLTKEIMYE